MRTVPIVFAFDSNLTFPACVCLSSLLMHANEETFYEIFILYPQRDDINQEKFNVLKETYQNCSIHFRAVDDRYASAYEIRGITTPAYFRLSIPELIPEYDRIIYSDVDVIFRRDLSELYSRDMGDKYISATYDLGLNLSEEGISYIQSVDGLNCGEYIQSGFIVINSKKILEDELLSRFMALSKKKFRYQDQDILNIVCCGQIDILPFTYNMTDQAYYYMTKELYRLSEKFLNDDLSKAYTISTIHYNGYKPWKAYCVNFDIWWEVYRNSPYYDPQFHFDFFYNKLDEYDRLPFMKRVKILMRYFFKKSH